MWTNNYPNVFIDSLRNSPSADGDGCYQDRRTDCAECVSKTEKRSLCKLDHVEVKGHSGDTVCACVLFLFVLDLLIDSNPMRGMTTINHVAMAAVAEGFPQERRERKNK